jgi:hypothetical protein
MDIRTHPSYTDDDYAYMVSRGYTDEQIADYWTAEAYRIARQKERAQPRPVKSSPTRCCECGAPGAVNDRGLGISCGCAAE